MGFRILAAVWSCRRTFCEKIISIGPWSQHRIIEGNENREVESLPMDEVIALYKEDVDRTLLIENLRCTVEERFRRLMALQKFAEELKKAGKRDPRG